MSFFVKAVVDGLRQFPAIGAEVDGNHLVYKNYCDIGVAIGGGKGTRRPRPPQCRAAELRRD
ncbi:MAG: 2-oxo acid dehydrogenase subunit E2 [Planctomycetaceae bacterium]